MKVILFLLIFFSVSIISIFAQEKGKPDPERFKTDPEYRRQWKDYEKRFDEVVAENKKIAENNAKIKVLFDAGNLAFNEKDYAKAIAKYDRILEISSYWATNFTVHINRCISHTTLGVRLYNEFVRKERKELTTANHHFKAAVNDIDIVARWVEQHRNTEDPTNRKLIIDNEYKVLRQRGESYRIYATTNPAIAATAIEMINKYLELETNEELRAAAYVHIQKLKSRSKIVGLGVP